MRGLWRSCWYAVPFRVWHKLRSRLPKSHQLPASHTQSKVLLMVLSFWMPHSMTEARSQEAPSGATFLLLLRQQHSSIQSWKFTPASRQGNPEPSVLRVAVVFRPRAYFAAGPAFTPLLSEGGTNREDQSYVPPGIVSVTYPQYPINAAAPGTVVIQVILGKSRSIQHLKVVRDLPPFTQFALSAVDKWRFQAATLDGRSITSNLVVAFVFPTLSER